MSAVSSTSGAPVARRPEISAENVEWLHAFEKEHGRPLRVLHVGNIANNAYLNSKFLREAGVASDVLCYDYYHIMACPEWEEAEISDDYGDDFSPRFSPRDLATFDRPRWFAQGPFLLGMAYLHAKNSGSNFLANILWRLLGYVRNHQPANFFLKIAIVFFGELLWAPAALARRLKRHTRRALRYLLLPVAAIIYAPLYLLSAIVMGVLYAFDFFTRSSASPLPAGGKPQSVEDFLRFRKRVHARLRGELVRVRDALSLVKRKFFGDPERAYMDDVRSAASRQLQKFETLFPERAGWATREQFVSATVNQDVWRKIFADYDVVQCYATDPLWAAIAEAKPYVAFEHGTLRDFTTRPDFMHTLTSLGYRQADHVFVTNGDCLEYAQRLRIPEFSAMLHPIDVNLLRRDFGPSVAELRKAADAEVVLVCPLRHDFKVKGTDAHVKALPLIRDRINGRVRVYFVNWGTQVEESRRMIEELGCSDMVTWLKPLSRIGLAKLSQASDVVLDQMVLPCFGSTAPQAIAMGSPVVSSYKPESTSWLLGERAPIMSAFTPEDVADAVCQAVKPEWREQYKKDARDWFDRYHHPDLVVQEHLRVYRKILDEVKAS